MPVFHKLSSYGGATVGARSTLQQAGCHQTIFGEASVFFFQHDTLVVQGEGYTSFGISIISRSIAAVLGDTSSFGVARTKTQVLGNSITHSAYGTPTYAYADGTDFVCGILPRATPPQGFDSVQFGTTGVTQ
jgi:hypothetical protein